MKKQLICLALLFVSVNYLWACKIPDLPIHPIKIDNSRLSNSNEPVLKKEKREALLHASRVRHLGADYVKKSISPFKTLNLAAGKYWSTELNGVHFDTQSAPNEPEIISGNYRYDLKYKGDWIDFKYTTQNDISNGYQYESPTGYFWNAQPPNSLYSLIRERDSDTIILSSSPDGTGSFEVNGNLYIEILDYSDNVTATINLGSGTIQAQDLSEYVPVGQYPPIRLFLSKPGDSTDKTLSLSQPLYLVNRSSFQRRFFEFEVHADQRVISPSNQQDNIADTVRYTIDFDPIVYNYAPEDIESRETWVEVYRIVDGDWEFIDTIANLDEGNQGDREIIWGGEDALGRRLPDGEYMLFTISINYDNYAKVDINNSKVTVPSPSPSPSPDDNSLPIAEPTDFKKEYLDAYNDQMVERVGIARRKLEWLIQVNRDKMAELEQQSFSTQSLQTRSFNLVRLEKMIRSSQQSLRILMTLVDANGCYNYYAFAAKPKRPRRHNGNNQEQDLSLKTIVAYNDEKGLYTKNRLIDRNENAPPSNIRSIYTGLSTNYLGMLNISATEHALTQPSSLIVSFTPYGSYQLTSRYKSELPDYVKVHASLYTGGKVVATNPSGTKVHVTWPAKAGVDLNRLPIPMYRYHRTESTRSAIDSVIKGIMSYYNSRLNSLNDFYPYSTKPSFVNHVCYNKNLETNTYGQTFMDNGHIDLSNSAFSTASQIKSTTIHELAHRLDWINRRPFSIVAEAELNAYSIQLKASNYSGVSVQEKGANEELMKDYKVLYTLHKAQISEEEKKETIIQLEELLGKNFVEANLRQGIYDPPDEATRRSYTSGSLSNSLCGE